MKLYTDILNRVVKISISQAKWLYGLVSQVQTSFVSAFLLPPPCIY